MESSVFPKKAYVDFAGETAPLEPKGNAEGSPTSHQLKEGEKEASEKRLSGGDPSTLGTNST